MFLVATKATKKDYVSSLSLGGSVLLVGLAVALLLFPSRAGEALSRQVAKLLPLLGKHLADAIDAALGASVAEADVLALNDEIRAEFAAGDTLATEARRELAGHLSDHADPAALLRTLRRLWNTELMAGRATRIPLPPTAVEPLRPALLAVRNSVSGFLEALVAVCVGTSEPPAMAGVDIALADLDRAMVQLRESGIARSMQADDVARVFSLCYALGQLDQNLVDLRDRCRDLRSPAKVVAD